jgi:hypothetical protein
MYQHGPNCLAGPRFRVREWWMRAALPRFPVAAPSEDAPIRWDLVERVRSAIAAGVYDTPEKWEATLDKLSQSLGV